MTQFLKGFNFKNNSFLSQDTCNRTRESYDISVIIYDQACARKDEDIVDACTLKCNSLSRDDLLP